MDKIMLAEFQPTNKIELSVKKQKEVEHELKGTIKPKAGQTVWEINETTGEIEAAKYKTNTVSYSPTLSLIQKLIINPDCVYIPALNKYNALKKYAKDKSQSSYYTKEAPMSLNQHF